MSGHAAPRGLPDFVSDARRRIETQERIRREPRRSFYVEYVLEFPDALFLNQETGRFPFKYPTAVVGWRATADTAGSTSTSIQIRKNATTMETLAIAASTQFLSTQTIEIGYARGDYLQGNVSVVGTGIRHVVVVLECVEFR